MRLQQTSLTYACAAPDSGKAIARQHRPFPEGTPSHLVMHTPSLNHQFGGSPNFAASPLGANDSILFTPSSRKLLRSMAPNPLDTVPFDVSTGLTPQHTPQTGHAPMSTTSAKQMLSSCKRSGRRAAQRAARHALDSDPEEHDKSTAIRRLCFEKGDGEGDASDAAAVAGMSPTTSAQAMPPPQVHESPLKRLRHGHEGDAAAAQKPLFVAVPSGSGATMPETPSQDAHMSDGKMGADDKTLIRAHNGSAVERGLSDSSCGKSSIVSTVEHMQSQESMERDACGDSLKLNVGQEGSLQLKNQLNSILNSMFA